MPKRNVKMVKATINGKTLSFQFDVYFNYFLFSETQMSALTKKKKKEFMTGIVFLITSAIYVKIENIRNRHIMCRTHTHTRIN